VKLRHRLTTLTARLVLTAVGLVILAGLLVATATTIGLRSYLFSQLDHGVQDTMARAMAAPRAYLDPNSQPSGSLDPDEGPRGQGAGTLAAATDGTQSLGYVLTADGGFKLLGSSQLSMLTTLPHDGSIHTVRLPSLGTYRVETQAIGSNGLVLISGLPTVSADQTVRRIVGLELGLTLVGVAVAAIVGTILVRKQLRPLQRVAATAHEVSELQLGSGGTDIAVRVPEELTNPLTEVGQVGEALNRMIDHVEASLAVRQRSEQQVRNFVADASHELRTPLATIQGYAELARRKGDQQMLTEALGKVEVEARRMSTLVEDLLLLARLDSGRPLAQREVDLTHLVLDAVEDVRVVAPDHRWTLELPDEPLTLVGDPDRLHQVISNLLSNARRHTAPGTSVLVSLFAADDGVVLEVADAGPGIDASVRERLFERFVRGDGSRSRESGGVGLGLALVKAIVEAHGGTIESPPTDQGATFIVWLPPGEPSE
jgi:two-component system OmpR family sensor kinase